MSQPIKTLLLVTALHLYCNTLQAQTDSARISMDIKKLSGEFMTDFKNIKGAKFSDNDYEALYHSRLKLMATEDSSNLIHFIKETQFWLFTTDYDKTIISAGALDSAIHSIDFSFGKVKRISSGADWIYLYVPEKKKELTEKLKSFFLVIFNHIKNPVDQTGGKLSFTLGQDENYRYK